MKKYKKYEKYKDSGIEWIGEIPEHWEVKKIKYFYNFSMGQTILKTNLINDGVIPVYSATESNAIFGYVNKANVILQKGDLVIPARGNSIGFVYLVEDKSTCTQTTIYGKRINKKITPKYLYYYQIGFRLNLFQFDRTAIPQITVEQVKENPILIFDVKEQTAIAEFLDRETARIDAVIEKKKKLIELLKEKRTALITKAVTKGLNPDVKMKDSGIEWIGEIPEHWEVKKFRFIFTQTKGLSITKTDLKDSGIPCVNYGEIHSKYGFEIIPERDKLLCVDTSYLKTSKKSLIKKGDFVFADTSEDIEGSGNFTHLHSDKKIFAGYHTIIARLKINTNYRYIAFYLDSISYRHQIRQKVKGIKVYSITNAILKNTYLLLPTLEEQTAIAEFLDRETAKIDDLISKIEKSIEKYEEYRSALITAAVTGKIKVTES